MELEDFYDAIKPFIALAGVLEQDKVDVYFSVLKNFQARVMRDAVTRILREHEYKSFPMPAVFYDAARAESAKYATPEAPDLGHSGDACSKCKGMGWIPGADLVSDGMRYEMTVPCDVCEDGKKKRRIIGAAGVRIHDAHEIEYYHTTKQREG